LIERGSGRATLGRMKALRLAKPCTEPWSSMERVANGRHCAACDKTVVDITRATAIQAAARALVFGDGVRFCGRAWVDRDGIVQHAAPTKPREDGKRLVRSLLVAATLNQVGCAAEAEVRPTVAESPSPPVGDRPVGAPLVATAELAPRAQCAQPTDAASTEPLAVALDPSPFVTVQAKGEMPIVQYVHFPSLSVALGENDLAIVREVAATLKEHPEIQTLDVEGHADPTEADGTLLGLKRATVVVQILVSSGIAADRLRAVSKGSAEPIESNDTAEGRAGNRRITFKAMP
jgi:outer membrane protein OmpA-like peptidoglycan-associated protein